MGQSRSKAITFHKNHGEDIELDGTESAAVRVDNSAKSWSTGLVFSSNPIKANEKIYVQLVVVSRASHDVISVGFTSRNPSQPCCSQTEDETTSWTCSLSKYFCCENTVLCFYVSDTGFLHYGKANCAEFTTLGKKINMDGPLWAVLHIWSEATTIKMLNEKDALQTALEMTEEDLFLDAEEEVGRRVTKDASAVTVETSEDSGVCAICYVDVLEVVFIPCGHMCTCFRCGQIVNNGDKLCPICRKCIRGVVRVFRA